MIREEYLRRLVDAAHVALYLSGSDGARVYWPWRMEPPHEASQSYRNACERYVIDSAPQREDITTRDALDTGHRLDAEVVSLADVYQDKDATVNALTQGLAVADNHPFNGTLLLPLQEPFVECYRELGEPHGDWIGLGGLKNASDHARIKAAREFRGYVGPDVHIHGFGWGPREELAAAIRETPTMLNSLDYSTPVRDAPRDVTPGDERMSVQAAYAGYRLVRDLREVTPHPDDPELSHSQPALGDLPTD
jgi:hypothetical protein